LAGEATECIYVDETGIQSILVGRIYSEREVWKILRKILSHKSVSINNLSIYRLQKKLCSLHYPSLSL